MKRFYFQTTVALLASLLLLACDDKNKNYPTDYVGFEHSMQSHFYSKSDKEETIEVKVIAVDKKKEDREVKLSINRSAIPGIGMVCKLNNDRLIIKAGKKEGKATITLFPGKAIKGEIIQIVCTPLWEGGQTSKMSIELIPK
ncbi:hypothetical protein [Bacteroides salyersiae]|jgi:hypothetical protein|uniref:hypothetical protein n=1 Tax=Bacteroides salyersiae TaxID=291644 RepID=UPI001C8B0C88|nr:hypothetical protein [Bacteroides salyersiae]